MSLLCYYDLQTPFQPAKLGQMLCFHSQRHQYFENENIKNKTNVIFINNYLFDSSGNYYA